MNCIRFVWALSGRQWLRSGWLMLLALAVSTPIWASGEVRMCEDGNYAPFIYGGPGNEGVARGATADFVRIIFQQSGIHYKISMMPWARCLAYVKTGLFQIGLDAYYDPDRAHDFLFSRPYFSLTPQYYYSRRRFPAGLNIRSRADLKKYQGCGIRGYSYAHYGLRSDDLDTDSNDHAALIRKVEYGRCDYFVEEMEVMQGYALTSHLSLTDSGLGHGPVPRVVAPQLHFMVTRAGGGASRLLAMLDQQIEVAHHKGIMPELVRQELSTAPR